MIEAVAITALCISVGYVSYQAGKSNADSRKYYEGWADCKWFHEYDKNVDQAARKLQEWDFKQSRLN